MMFLHTLRLAGDLSFYYAFAGFFAASFGGTPMPLVLVWPALCFGLASCFEGSRPLRTTLAALSAAALLLLPTGADKFCYFPAAVYPVLLAYTGDFALSPMRQAERLRWLCRVWPFFAVAMLLWNANAVLSAALPFAMVAAVLLVGFNRTARQDPEISTRPGYLLLSGGVLAAVFCMLANRYRRKEKVPLAAWLCLAAQAAGAAVMILAPGNFARASAYAYDSMLLEIIKRLIRITAYTAVYAGALLAMLQLTYGMGLALGAPMRGRRGAWLLLAALLSAYAMAASPELSDRSYTCVIVLVLAALATLVGDIDTHVRALDAAKLCALPFVVFLLIYGGHQAVRDVSAHEAAWNAQLSKIEQAIGRGEASVKIESVESRSRFTMSIQVEPDAQAWPNSTLSKWFGVAVYGE